MGFAEKNYDRVVFWEILTKRRFWEQLIYLLLQLLLQRIFNVGIDSNAAFLGNIGDLVMNFWSEADIQCSTVCFAWFNTLFFTAI